MLRLLNLSKRSPIFQYGKFSTSVHIKPSDTLEFGKHSTPLDINKFEKGKVIHGFIVEDVARVEEMYLDAIKLTHLNTRAQYLHLARDDTNNVFCTAFRTTPMDSTGSPHILEHTILCGSERYPCRDPFFKMLRRSLATFINAMTGPDYTMYPFSTQNLKDFQNLQSVYLDSVFRPLLRELDFRQEGWRLEHADVHDKNSPIIFKGVVFNEMKGVFLENQSIFAEKLLNSILPSHTYAFISGGDPLVIPQLEYRDFLNFHKTHYHPSNARFYSYGNFPLENHLKFINDRYLFFADHVDTSSTEVPSEKRWTIPKKEHVFCRPDPMIADPNRQGCIAIGQLCTDITDIQTNFELYVLSQLLLKGPNSAFYKSLVDTNIGTGFGPVTGFDANCKDSMFVVSLQGVELNNFDKVENIYNETAAQVIEKGFDKDHIEAVLHNIELSMKHQVSNFGLHLLFNLTPLWNHNGDVIKSMGVSQAVEKLRENLKADPKYLQRLVEKYLLKNSHRLTLTMSPDEEFENKRMNAERELLEAKLKDLTGEDKERIYLDGLALLADQEKKEDSSMLPTLNIQDLKADVDRYEHTDLIVQGVPLQLSIQPTNGVSYYRGIINTKDLSSDLKHLLPVFNNVISKMGTQNHDYRSFDRMIELKTGGLHFVNHVIEHKSNKGEYEEGVLIESHCLDRNMNDMWKIWTELFNNVKLTDIQRFDTLTKMHATDLVNGIADAGHNYAMTSAASLISPIANRKENLSGLNYVRRMKKLAQLKDLSPVLSQIQEISRFILNKNHFRTAINTSKEHKDELIRGMEEFYNSLEGSPKDSYLMTKEEDSKEPQESGIHHVLPYNVNYCSKALSIPPYKDPEYPVLQVLAKLLTSIYLLPEVREKGGAYGAGAITLPDGIFTFYSYRDPHSTRTMDLFDATYDFLSKYEFPERDINEAKLGVFQKVDAPVSPSDRGMAKFIHNLTYDHIQKQRELLKAVDKDQLVRVVDKYLKPNQSGIKVGRALIGSHNPDLSAKYSQNWTIVDQEEDTQARMAT